MDPYSAPSARSSEADRDWLRRGAIPMECAAAQARPVRRRRVAPLTETTSRENETLRIGRRLVFTARRLRQRAGFAGLRRTENRCLGCPPLLRVVAFASNNQRRTAATTSAVLVRPQTATGETLERRVERGATRVGERHQT